MSPALQADALVAAIDHAEARAAAVGRGLTDVADDLDSVSRKLSAHPTDGGWSGRTGARARLAATDAAAESRMIAGACLFLSDVLRVEGAGLARAVVSWADDDTARPGSGDRAALTDADHALTLRLREAADALAGAADPDTRPCLDLAASTGDDPRRTAALWHSLGPIDRERLARDHPDMGSVAGLSSATRDAINRTRLRRLLDAPGLGPDLPPGDTAGADARTGLAALAAYLDADPDRHLLSVHPDGRAVVASGNPDSADRVVTMVPGTGSSLRTLERTGARADAMCEAAAAAAAGESGESGAPAEAAEPTTPVDACVAVAWQGYDAPDTIPEAGRSVAPARAHADDLRTFAAGVDAVESMDGHDAPHAVVGYSYGSATLGAAASDPAGLAADRMIHVGSPGAAASSLDEQWVDDAGAARRADPDEVVGVASRWDPVPWYSIIGVLGERPGTDGFGGTAVDVTEPGSGPGSINEAHSRYFDRGTVSLEEIGRIIADTD